MEGQHVVWQRSGVRVLGHILGKESVQEREGEVSELLGAAWQPVYKCKGNEELKSMAFVGVGPHAFALGHFKRRLHVYHVLSWSHD